MDVLVNNAGYGLIGGIEEVNAREAHALFSTNLEGTLYVLRAALPGIRRRRSENIVNISSLGGFSASAGGVSTTLLNSPWAERIIGDYHESLSGLSNRMVQLSCKQPGDPALAAKAIFDVIHSGSAPLRLALGSDCLRPNSRKAQFHAPKSAAVGAADQIHIVLGLKWS
ncbi:SDR family NAD(P)-dependent oxidoreductase [Phyllobacterium endophyticum]|uniref:SDR family NAD(P)-dependent oxidoreductase n=1 Tax=Phyllobacterium endophyticum TaxID=1149773 RepID=UPI00387EC1B4